MLSTTTITSTIATTTTINGGARDGPCADTQFQKMLSPQRSLKIIENVTIRYRANDFLLMFYSNYGSISCRFWDIQYRKILQPWNPSQEPNKVIESRTIRQTEYSFLVMFYSNFVPKTHLVLSVLESLSISETYKIGPWLL